jgi:hypothetical protein
MKPEQHLSRLHRISDATGLKMMTAVTQPAVLIAMLADDPATAEMHLRFAYESLSLTSEKDNLPPRQRHWPEPSQRSAKRGTVKQAN